jgi:hypothetical protein
MKRSVDRILTTHVGSLPRPNDLVELYRPSPLALETDKLHGMGTKSDRN